MRVTTIPIAAQPFEWDRNTQLAWHAMQCGEQADLVLLPELFAAGYSYDRRVKSAAESRTGTTIEWMRAASQAFDTYVGGTFVENVDGAIYNTFALVGPKRCDSFLSQDFASNV